LHSFDEETMIRLMGRDLALYLKFLKFQAAMFFAIFLFSFSIIIPLYWAGKDALDSVNLEEKDKGYNLIMLTILNI